MRAEIRKQLIDNTSLDNCYEPNVPNSDTPKPYAVIVQKEDNDNGEVVGFKRSIEVWIYDDNSGFNNLDKLVKETVKALDMKTMGDSEAFTCIYNGLVGQDVVDEEWQAIARGLSFNVLDLQGEEELNTDTWLDAIKAYTNMIVELPVYLNKFQKKFEVPCILWRTSEISKNREGFTVIKEHKTLKCHIVSRNKNQINLMLDTLEDNMINDYKIPYDIADRRYMTVESISENREADMFTTGQLTLKLFKRKSINKKEVVNIASVNGSGKLRRE